jgi:hypothetical protein
MSLNRTEQRVFDYLMGHPDERQHWVSKVQSIAAAGGEAHAMTMRLEAELGRYLKERSEMVPALRDLAQHEGAARTSLRNLAEHMTRLWVAPRPKKKPPGQEPAV